MAYVQNKLISHPYFIQGDILVSCPSFMYQLEKSGLKKVFIFNTGSPSGVLFSLQMKEKKDMQEAQTAAMCHFCSCCHKEFDHVVHLTARVCKMQSQSHCVPKRKMDLVDSSLSQLNYAIQNHFIQNNQFINNQYEIQVCQ